MKQTFKKLMAVIIAITMILGISPFFAENVEAANDQNCSVIFINETPVDTFGVPNDLNKYVKETVGNSSKAVTKIYNIRSYHGEFVKAWNSMPDTQNVVVICAHGYPYGMKGEDPNPLVAPIISTSSLKDLNWKNISKIVLLGCNTGHYDYRTENLARAMADKFRCTVIASDGTAFASGIYYGLYRFRPIGDPEWVKWGNKVGSSRTKYLTGSPAQYSKCYGWLAYIPKELSNNYQGKLYRLDDVKGKDSSVYEILHNYSFGSKTVLSVR